MLGHQPGFGQGPVPRHLMLMHALVRDTTPMKHTFWVYPARDVAREERAAKMPADPSYSQLCKVLDPLFFNRRWEHVNVLFEGCRADMFVDERGRLDDLPRNEAATAIYRAGWLARYPESDPEDLHWIAGTAVLFERIVWS